MLFSGIILESLGMLFCISKEQRSNLVIYGYVTFAITPIFVETEAAHLSFVFQCTANDLNRVNLVKEIQFKRQWTYHKFVNSISYFKQTGEIYEFTVECLLAY